MTLMPQPAAVSPLPVDHALAALEPRFAGAGAELQFVLDELRGLRGLFARLAEAFGPPTHVELQRLTRDTEAALEQIDTGVRQFLQDTDAMSAIVRSFRGEVADLDRAIRTLANLAVNARLQGYAMVPPRPQVAAFVASLSQMTLAAEAVLAEVRQVMAETATDLAEITRHGASLRHRLSVEALPLLRQTAASGQRRLHDHEGINALNERLAGRMRTISDEVARLAIALQCGDATRQRLERARAILTMAPDAPGSPWDRTRLAAALIRGAKADSAAEITAAMTAFGSTSAAASTAIHEARGFYLGHEAAEDNAREGALTQTLGSLGESLRGMAQRTAGLARRVGLLVELGLRLRGIAQEIRLSGLNAALVCAKLGPEGLPLREIARWLRELTDACDGNIHNLQALLNETRAQGARVGSDQVEQLLAAVERAAELAVGLCRRIEAGQDAMAEAVVTFDGTGRAIPARLGQGMRLLAAARNDQAALAEFANALDLLADAQQAAAPGAAGAAVDTGPALADLRRLYTMDQERAIHDRLFGAPEPVPDAPDKDASSQDDLSDILF